MAFLDTNELESFVRKYNHFDDHPHTERFVRFYSKILECLTDDQTLQDDVLQIVGCFVEQIRILDHLFDREALPLGTAFQLVFPEFEKTRRQEHGHDALSESARVAVDTSRRLSAHVCQIVDRRVEYQDRFRSVVDKGLTGVLHYGEREAAAMVSGITSEEYLEELLIDYNCDFHLYNSLIFDLFLPDSEISQLRKGLDHYFVIDGILDTLCDLFDDEKAGGFNFAVSLLGCRKTGFLRRDLHENGVYAQLFAIASKHCAYCRQALGQMSNRSLARSLSGNL